MKNVIEFIKKYKVHILTTLLLIFMFRSCHHKNNLRKLRVETQKELNLKDSMLNESYFILDSNRKVISNIPNLVRDEKLKVHYYYDNWISSKDRGPQLMELHTVVKNNIKELNK